MEIFSCQCDDRGVHFRSARSGDDSLAERVTVYIDWEQ